MNNLIKKNEIKKYFSLDNINFTISSRGIRKDIDILDYLKIFFPYVNIGNVESLFGFVDDFSSLYGGRPFHTLYSLDKNHLENMYKNNIGLSLTLTNHHFSEEEYQKSLSFLDKYHKEGNSIVCTNDILARRIKNDFPKYKTKASLIKEINTLDKVKKALEIYDYVVIPMDLNDDDEFLNSLPEKDRIILFANANCAYNCKSRICYKTISDKTIQKNKIPKMDCSKEITPRLDEGHVFFNIEKLSKMGFKNFKLVPNLNEISLSLARKFSNSKNYYLNNLKDDKELIFLNSFPKSGRTWVRFILANYFNKLYNLDLNVTLQNMFEIMPNDYVNDEPKSLSNYQFINNKSISCIISSHDKPNKYLSFGKQIFLIRLVYDVIVSDYFQHINLLNLYDKSISEFIKEKNGSLERYCNYINELSKTLETIDNQCFIFTYEMLHENTYKIISDLLSFMNIEKKKNLLSESIKNSTFKSMTKVEKDFGLAGCYESSPKNQNARRVREGIVGNYKKYLNKNDIDYIRDTSNLLLSKNSKELLSKYYKDYK